MQSHCLNVAGIHACNIAYGGQRSEPAILRYNIAISHRIIAEELQFHNLNFAVSWMNHCRNVAGLRIYIVAATLQKHTPAILHTADKRVNLQYCVTILQFSNRIIAEELQDHCHNFAVSLKNHCQNVAGIHICNVATSLQKYTHAILRKRT